MSWWRKLAARRPPDFTVVIKGQEYMQRWWVIPRNRIFNIYLHRFLHDDEDEALHDHPWFNASFILKGTYTEWSIKAGGVHSKRIAKEGSFKVRMPHTAHRIALHDGECWTLFMTGPVIRTWGFHCQNGWTDWRSYKERKVTGRGCP